MKDHLIQFKVTLSNWKENTNEEATSRKRKWFEFFGSCLQRLEHGIYGIYSLKKFSIAQRNCSFLLQFHKLPVFPRRIYFLILFYYFSQFTSPSDILTNYSSTGQRINYTEQQLNKEKFYQIILLLRWHRKLFLFPDWAHCSNNMLYLNSAHQELTNGE